MLRTLATALHHEARLASSPSRLATRRTLHVSRQCMNESPPVTVAPAGLSSDTASEAVLPKEKKPRKKRGSEEAKKPKPRKPKEEKVPKPSKPAAKSILQQGKLLQQLREFERPGQSLSLEDFERYRPEESNPDVYSAEYPKDYKLRLDELDKHFNKQQMLDALKLYDIRPGSALTKKTTASLILKQWGWPRPGKHDRTIVTRDFPLKMSEALLVMMHESRQFGEWLKTANVKVRIVREPLSLHTKGYSSLVNAIASQLEAIRQEIVTSTFSSPIKSTLSNDQLGRISKEFLAIAENLDEGQIRISYFKGKPESLEKTKRAILAAAYDMTLSTKPPLYYHQVSEAVTTSETPLYSILPFSPMTTATAGPDDAPTFRLERVDGPTSSPIDELAPVMTDVSLESLSGVGPATLELKQWLRNLKDDLNAKLRVKASPGHVVVTPTEERAFTTSSPLPGQQELGSVVDWIRRQNGHRSDFHPCVPKSVFEFPSVSSRSVQRLVYSEEDKSASAGNTTLQCEMSIHSADFSGSQTVPTSGMTLPIANSFAQWHVTCEGMTTSVLDVLNPDRPMDLRFTAEVARNLEEVDFPEPLRAFAVQMRDIYQQQLDDEGSEYLPSTGSPPLIIYYQGKRLVLTSFNSVRVNRKQAEKGPTAMPLEVITENIVDIDNNMTSGDAVCYVSCDPEMTEIQWEHFLKNCTWLTRAGASNISPPVFEEDIVGGLSL